MTQHCTSGNLKLWKAQLSASVSMEEVGLFYDENHQKIDDAITALQAQSRAANGLSVISISGTLNGSNRTFDLASAPALLLFFRNGNLQRSGEGNDFTLNAAQITTAIPPAADDWLFALGI